MEREFYRVEHGGKFKGHFSNMSFDDFEAAKKYREDIKDTGNVEYWNEVYEASRIVKVKEIVEVIEC